MFSLTGCTTNFVFSAWIRSLVMRFNDHMLVKSEKPGEPPDFCQRATCGSTTAIEADTKINYIEYTILKIYSWILAVIIITVLVKWHVVHWQRERHSFLPCFCGPSQFIVNFIVLTYYNTYLSKEFAEPKMAGTIKQKNSPNGLFELADMTWREF